MYKLFTDKGETFECKVQLEGASIKSAVVRLLIETDELNLVFNGSVNSLGECKIPIRKLRGLFDEATSGTMRLEVIAEDTYFQPWESPFTVDVSKKVTVEVRQAASDISETTGPKVKVTSVVNPTAASTKPSLIEDTASIKDLLGLFKEMKITRNKFVEHKQIVLPIIKQYLSEIGYEGDPVPLIKEVLRRMPK